MLIQFTLLLPALESKHSIQWYKKFSPLVRTGVDFIADFFQSRSITTFKIMANFVCVFKSQLSSIHLKLLCVQCTYISLPIPTHHAYSALPEVRILILTPFYLLIESNLFFISSLCKKHVYLKHYLIFQELSPCLSYVLTVSVANVKRNVLSSLRILVPGMYYLMYLCIVLYFIAFDLIVFYFIVSF